MNADVEKAVERFIGYMDAVLSEYPRGEADWQTILAALRDQEAEIARLRSLITDKTEHSHRCKRCLHPYTPKADQSEDCPACGFDGITTHLGGEHE